MTEVFFRFCRLGWDILGPNKRRTLQLYKELNTLLSPKGFALTEDHKKRIFFYTAQSAITNHWFGLLRGHSANQQEIQDAIYLGAFTPIADDLMDQNNLSFESLLEARLPESADTLLFDYLLKKLDSLRKANPHFESYFIKAHLAQNESLKQLGKEPLSEEELESISFNKGGLYTLLYRHVLKNQPVAGEDDSIFTLGSILQLLNDLFDLHKDYHNGVQTLINYNPNIHAIEKRLEALNEKFLNQYTNLDYPKTNIRKSILSIWAITTRGDVAIEQYGKIQGSANQINISEYERKPLIVDMEKIGNVLKNLKATAKRVKALK